VLPCLGSALALALLVAACTEQPTTPTAPNRAEPNLSSVAPRSGIEHPGEAAFEEISQTVPSFAGYFLEGGQLVVYVTDLSQAQAAEAVRRVNSTGRGDALLAHASTVVRPARYSFLQLRQWRDQIEQNVLFGLSDAASIDLDEGINRIVVGLADGSGKAQLENGLTRLGVPTEAVDVQVTGRVSPSTLLTDSVRPVEGGLASAVTFNDTAQTVPWCTFGFNAYYGSTAVVLTSSHCTSQTYGDDPTPTVFYQNLITSGDRIGSEWYDPSSFFCNSTVKCRYSDAAMIKYDSGVNFQLASIARTLSYDTTWGVDGSKTIDSSNPQFSITSEQDYLAQGYAVDKVGRTTGWTRGTILGTCVDFLGSDGYWRLCSDKASYWADSGDSGSPVFYDPGDGDQVTLTGIHWGANSGSQYTAFSPFGGIRQDFGDTITTYFPPLSVTLSGPRIVGMNETCTWTANASGGTSPYTYDWERNMVSVGSGQSYTANTGTSNFRLDVNVTDAVGSHASDGFVVSVTDTTGVCY
jgi:hypothetical protein